MTKLIYKNNKRKVMLNRILSCTVSIFIMVTFFSFVSADELAYDVNTVVSMMNNGGGPYKTIREIIGVLSWIGFAVATLKLAQIGFLFMLSGTKKRSDAKAALLPWAVGAAVCLLFGSVGPWAIGLIMGPSSKGPFDI